MREINLKDNDVVRMFRTNARDGSLDSFLKEGGDLDVLRKSAIVIVDGIVVKNRYDLANIKK